MRVYEILQSDPRVIKNLMAESSSGREKGKLAAGMALRAALIVLFAIVFVSLLSAVFGGENTPMAVVVFCILLGVRFVDFGYCIRDSLAALGGVFLLLLISPVLASSVFPLLGFFIHGISFLMILFLACDRPELGNGGLFGFAYIYLTGNPVYGAALVQRGYLTVTGFFLCGLIFYVKHRDKNRGIRITEKLRMAKITEFKYQWMIRMSVGVSAILSLCLAFDLERFMWAGFACSSLLSQYSPRPEMRERFVQRLTGVMAGSCLFYLIYQLLPAPLHEMIGPLGGFCLGFCADYKYKTALNCLGALMSASGLYGLEPSIILRITNTVLGIVFAISFYDIWDKYIDARIGRRNQVTDCMDME